MKSDLLRYQTMNKDKLEREIKIRNKADPINDCMFKNIDAY